MFMFSIRATRLGFLYQDKFALFKYLSSLHDGDLIDELYVDYPLGASQKSLDVRMIKNTAGRSTEYIYEVKTGQAFKDDRRYDGTSEIREAILNFKDYCGNRSDLYATLIISPELKGIISSYWNALQAIERSSTYYGAVELASHTLNNLLKFPDITEPKKLYKFCKRIDLHIHDSFSDLPIEKGKEHTTDMDEKITGMLRNLNNVFEVDAFEDELPPSLLYHTLLQEIFQHVGTATNLVPSIDTVISSFFARRKLIKKREDAEFHIEKQNTERVFREWKLSTPTLSSTANNTASIIEGGVAL